LKKINTNDVARGMRERIREVRGLVDTEFTAQHSRSQRNLTTKARRREDSRRQQHSGSSPLRASPENGTFVARASRPWQTVGSGH